MIVMSTYIFIPFDAPSFGLVSSTTAAVSVTDVVASPELGMGSFIAGKQDKDSGGGVVRGATTFPHTGFGLDANAAAISCCCCCC